MISPVAPTARDASPALAGADVGTGIELAQAFPQSPFADVYDPTLAMTASPKALDLRLSPPVSRWISQTAHARGSGQPGPAIEAEFAADLVQAADMLALGEDVIEDAAKAWIMDSARTAYEAMIWAQSRKHQPGGQAVYAQALRYLALTSEAPPRELLVDLQTNRAPDASCIATTIVETLLRHPQAGHADLLRGLTQEPIFAILLGPHCAHTSDDEVFDACLHMAIPQGQTVVAYNDSSNTQNLDAFFYASSTFAQEFCLLMPQMDAEAEMLAWAMRCFVLERLARACISADKPERMRRVLVALADPAALAHCLGHAGLMAHAATHGTRQTIETALDVAEQASDEDATFGLAYQGLEAALSAGCAAHVAFLLGWLQSRGAVDAFVASPAFRRTFAKVAAQSDLVGVATMAQLADLAHTFDHVVASDEDRWKQCLVDANHSMFAHLPVAIAKKLEAESQAIFPTPLAAAAAAGAQQAVQLLLQVAGPARAGEFVRLEQGEALEAAAGGGHLDLLDALIARTGESTARRLVIEGRQLDGGADAPFYALKRAWVEGHVACATRLLALVGAEAIQTFEDRMTLLPLAAACGDVAIFKTVAHAVAQDDELGDMVEGIGARLAARAIGRGHASLLHYLESLVSPDTWRSILAEALQQRDVATPQSHDLILEAIKKLGTLPAAALGAHGGTLFHASSSGNMTLLATLYAKAASAGTHPWGDFDGQALHGLLEGRHTGRVEALIALIGSERLAAHMDTPVGEMNLHVAIAQNALSVVEALLRTYSQVRGSKALQRLLSRPARSAYAKVLAKYTEGRAYVLGRSVDSTPTTPVDFAESALSLDVMRYLSKLRV